MPKHTLAGLANDSKSLGQESHQGWGAGSQSFQHWPDAPERQSSCVLSHRQKEEISSSNKTNIRNDRLIALQLAGIGITQQEQMAQNESRRQKFNERRARTLGDMDIIN